MDAFLDHLGLYRSDVAKDSTCFFRAVSEQLFYSQVHHHEIRQCVIDYVRRHKHDFEGFVDDVNDHLNKLDELQVWAGLMEMHALSLKYSISFKIYTEVSKPPADISSTDFSNAVVVLAGFGGNRFDCVYSKSFLSASAVCQSITYQVLYKSVFRLGEDVDIAVEKMLHDKNYSKQRRNLCQAVNLKQSTEEDEVPDETAPKEKDPSEEIKRALEQGIPPFPYKVAKALDPYIYRNVEFDIWNEQKKETLKQEHFYTPDIEPGVKCKVRLEDEAKSPLTGHIQEVSKSKVVVYIEELCKRVTVLIEDIEVLPIPQYKALTWQGGKTYRIYREPSRTDSDKKSKKKHMKRSPCESLEADFSNENGDESKGYTFTPRFRTPPREKHRFMQVSGNGFKKYYMRKSGQSVNNFFSDASNSSVLEYSDLNENDIQPGIAPPVPAPLYNSEQDSGLCTMTYNSSEFSSETSISRDFTFPDVYYSTPEVPPVFSPDNSTFMPSDPLKVDYHPSGIAASTPLQIPRAPNYYHQEDLPIFPVTPSTPTMTFLPLPTYYVYQERPRVHSLPPGSDINAGVPSVFMNTPPTTGVTPPQVAWFPNYHNMVQQNYGITSTVQTSYLACTPPMSAGDVSAFPNNMYNSTWNTAQPNYMLSASPVAYPFQPVVVPVPDQSPV